MHTNIFRIFSREINRECKHTLYKLEYHINAVNCKVAIHYKFTCSKSSKHYAQQTNLLCTQLNENLVIRFSENKKTEF